MKSLLNPLAHGAAQVVFGVLTPMLLIPSVAKRTGTRRFVAFVFGRAYGDRYDEIIESFGDSYGKAMAHGVRRAVELRGRSRLKVIVDCGTGTGFVSQQAAGLLPEGAIIATDLLAPMLRLAKQRCESVGAPASHLQADAFSLPLADGSVDLVMAQNTMPCFHEFARVLRPGGIVLYVDTSAGWIAPLARWLVRRQGLFERVEGEHVDTGFVVVAQASSGQPSTHRRS